jgi:hypothetical protein
VSPTDDRSISSSGNDENRRLKKADSLKENDRTVGRTRPLVSRAAKMSFSLPSRPAPINSQSSGVLAMPPTKRPEPAYPFYDYADSIPKPKVIYIRDEEQANDMIASLNG